MFEDDFDNEQDDFFAEGQEGNTSDYSSDLFSSDEESNVQPQQEVETSLGYKTVGIVVALVLVVLALVILGLSNIKLVKKNNDTQPQQVQQVQTKEEEPISTPEVEDSTEVSVSTNTGLISIPSGTYMDYSSSIIAAQGVVQSLDKYLQDGQVIYCITLDISIGTTSTSVRYYCGYNVFSQVDVGDILSVEYQQVSETCFSVCTISK